MEIDIQTQKPVYKFKITSLGEASVGKSSIIIRLHENAFYSYNNSTIGAMFIDHKMITKNALDKDIVISLNLWDTAGQERYHCLSPMYTRGAHAIILTFDLTNKKTFKQIKKYWMITATRNKGDTENPCVYYLLGNKSDLVDRREVPESEVNEYLRTLTVPVKYFETSAKSGENINEFFNEMAHHLTNNYAIIKSIELKEKNKKKDVDISNEEIVNNNSCCYT